MAWAKNNLTDQDNPTYCAHPGCHCKVEPGEKYCSDSCGRELNGGPCSCGHPDCQLEPEELL